MLFSILTTYMSLASNNATLAFYKNCTSDALLGVFAHILERHTVGTGSFPNSSTLRPLDFYASKGPHLPDMPCHNCSKEAFRKLCILLNAFHVLVCGILQQFFCA